MRKNHFVHSLRKGQELLGHQQTGDFIGGNLSERDSGRIRELAMIRPGPDMTKQIPQEKGKLSMLTNPEIGNHLTHSLGSENDSKAPQGRKEVPLERHPPRDTPGGGTDRNTEPTLHRPVETDSRKLEKLRQGMGTP